MFLRLKETWYLGSCTSSRTRVVVTPLPVGDIHPGPSHALSVLTAHLEQGRVTTATLLWNQVRTAGDSGGGSWETWEARASLSWLHLELDLAQTPSVFFKMIAQKNLYHIALHTFLPMRACVQIRSNMPLE